MVPVSISTMARPTESLRLPWRKDRETLIVPSFWPRTLPAWQRDRGKTVVLVIDDMIQSAGDLTDEEALKHRMLAPLNVELVFCPECRNGSETARDGRWIPAAERLLETHRARACAIFLDLLFEGDLDPTIGAGMAFLRQLRQRQSRLPVLILTNEHEERHLQVALAREGLHNDYLRKGSDDLISRITRFLVEQGWIAQPTFGAFSAAMREQVCRLRQYAFLRERLETGVPAPILITGDSGSGKSHLAHRAAEWLMSIEPAVRQGSTIETFVASEFERGQSATIELFGRGAMEAHERATLAGLVVLGKAQKADQGILVVEELGNSSHDLQRLLLGFVETGRTQPLFPNNEMNERSLGPLDVLCIFTAQPRHLTSGDIIDDLRRRATHGRTILEIPPLRERTEDIVPIFYATLKSLRRASDPEWSDPDLLDDIILQEAQQWLEDTATTACLSASSVADLVGQPRIPILGIPYLEEQLRRRLPTTISAPNSAGDPLRQERQERGMEPATPVPVDIKTNSDGWKVVSALADNATFSFPRQAEELRGKLSEVEAAASNLLLSYLEACLEVVKGAGSVINVTGTYKFQTGESDLQTNQVKGQYGKLFELERTPRMALEKVRRSDLLASLALAIGTGNRRQGIANLIEQLAGEPDGRDRLRRLLSMLRPGNERSKAEELLDDSEPRDSGSA